MPEKTLLLFTESFPYGKSESFIETEILYLAEAFREVLIFPGKAEGEKRPLPSNVKVVQLPPPGPIKSVRNFLFRHGGDLMRIYTYEMFHAINPKPYRRAFKNNFNFLIGRYFEAIQLEKELNKYDLTDAVVYTYWFKDWASKLCMIKWRGKLNFQHYTRVHGYDYDLKQNGQGYFPFRAFEMKQIDRIYSPTRYGLRYIKGQYPTHADKLNLSHVSVKEKGDNPWQEKGAFHIVSCGYLVPLKRTHLIPEILQHLHFEVIWTHFGDGPDETKVLERASQLPANIQFDYRGFTPNKKIIRFYQENSVDMIIHLSEREGGAPVAIQEACSFGIPAIGADADGTPEIVNAETGFLIPNDFDPKEVAELIRQYHLNTQDKSSFRKGVKAYWQREFDAENVGRAFAREIAQLPRESSLSLQES